jgi:hypothetical protein
MAKPVDSLTSTCLTVSLLSVHFSKENVTNERRSNPPKSFRLALRQVRSTSSAEVPGEAWIAPLEIGRVYQALLENRERASAESAAAPLALD